MIVYCENQSEENFWNAVWIQIEQKHGLYHLHGGATSSSI